MSTTVDERIVQMKFDNSNFESNVSESMSTLDKLKDKLNNFKAKFSTDSIDMEGLNKSISNVSFTPMQSGLEAASKGFSKLENIAIGTLRKIGEDIEVTGKKLISAFTVDPVKSGFAEFELKMGSVQTIMAGTGESLDTVNKYLDELNTYSDKTIYSFSDMTQNIGKFTNAGVKLEDAVAAIKGVSNEAAVSGANANEASRAMYNFAQALSAGYVKLIDWKSIENANMATVEFKDTLIQTGLAMGTLKKEGDKYVTTTTNMQGKISEAFDATHGFNDALAHQWMTTDVLTQTLSLYSNDVREMTEAEKKSYEEKLKSVGYTEEQIKKFEELGSKAYDSAQDVKTFTMMMDTLKEAAQSGWSQSFELIFGDFNEGKTLWTNLAKIFGDIIDASSKARNSILKEWKELGGRDDLIEAFKNIINSIQTIVSPIKEAFGDIFPPITGKRLKDITEKIKNFTKEIVPTEEHLDQLKRLFEGLFSVIKTVGSIIGKLISVLSPAGNALSNFTFNFAEKIGDLFVGISYLLEDGLLFSDIIDRIGESIKAFNDSFSLSGRYSIFDYLGDIFDKEALGHITLVGNALDGVTTIIERLLIGIINFIGTLTGLDLDFIVDGIIDTAINFDNVIRKIEELFFGGGGNLKKAFDSFLSIFTGGTESLKEFFEKEFKQPFLEAGTFIGGITTLISRSFNRFAQSFLAFIGVITGFDVRVISETIAKAIKTLNDGIVNFFKSIKNGDFVKMGENTIKGFIEGMTSSMKEAISKVKEFAQKIIDTVCNVLGIHSPSRVFMKIGLYIVLGLVGGITAGFALYKAGAFKAIESFISELTDKLSGVKGTKKSVSIFDEIINSIKVMLTNFKNKLIPLIDPIVNFIKNAFNKIKPYLTLENLMRGLGIVAIFKVLTLIKKAMELAESLVKRKSPLGALTAGITDILKPFKKAATEFGKAAKWQAFAEAVKQLTIMFAVIAASVAVFSFIPFNDLVHGLEIFGTLTVLIGAFIVVMSKCVKTLESAKIAALMFSLAAAFAAIAKTFKQFEGFNFVNDWQQLVAFFITFTGVIAILTTAVGLLSVKAGKLSKGTLIFVSISWAITNLMKTFNRMKEMNVKDGLSALVTLVVSILSFAAIMSQLEKVDMKSGFGALLGIISLIMLMKAISKLFNNNIVSDAEKLQSGLLVWALAMTSLLVFIKLIEKAGDAMLKTGKGMLAMVASLGLLALIIDLVGKEFGKDPKPILIGIIVVTALSMFLATIYTVFNLIDKKFGNIKKVRTNILALSGALALLSGMVMLVSLIPSDQLNNGAKAIVSLGVMLTLMYAVVNKFTKSNTDFDGMGKMMMKFSYAIAVMAASLAVLSFFPWQTLLPAAGMLTLVIIATGEAIKEIAKNKIGDNTYKTVIAFVFMLSVVCAGLAVLSTIGNVNLMLTAALSIAGIFIALSYAFTEIEKGLKGTTITKQRLILLGEMILSIVAIAGSLALLSQFGNVGTMLASIVAISAIIAAIVLAMKQISKVKTDKNALIALGEMILSVVAIAFSLLLLKGINLASIAPSVLGIITIIGMLAVLAKSIEKINSTGAVVALGEMIAMIAVLAIAFGVLASINVEASKFIVIAAAFGVAIGIVTVALIALAKFSTELAQLGPSLISVGAGLVTVGVGLAAILLPIALVAIGIAAIIAAIALLVYVVKELFALVGENGPQIAQGIVIVAQGIAIAISTISQAINMALSNLVLTILTNLGLISMYLQEHSIKDGAMIAAFIAEVCAGVAMGISEIVAAISEGIIQIAGALGEGIVLFATTIIEGIPPIVDAVLDLILQIKQVFEDHESDFEDIGTYIMKGLANGIFGGFSGIISGALSGVGKMIDTVCSFLGIHSPSTLWEWIGAMCDAGLVDGLKNGQLDIDDVASKMGYSSSQSFLSTFKKNAKEAGVSFLIPDDLTAKKATGEGLADTILNFLNNKNLLEGSHFDQFAEILGLDSKSLDFDINSDGLSGLIEQITGAKSGLTDLDNTKVDIDVNSDDAKKATDAVSDLDKVVKEVIAGKWGNGQARWDKLTEAGYNWAEVQNKVNEELGCSVRHSLELGENAKKAKKDIEDANKAFDTSKNLRERGFSSSMDGYEEKRDLKDRGYDTANSTYKPIIDTSSIKNAQKEMKDLKDRGYEVANSKYEPNVDTTKIERAKQIVEDAKKIDEKTGLDKTDKNLDLVNYKVDELSSKEVKVAADSSELEQTNYELDATDKNIELVNYNKVDVKSDNTGLEETTEKAEEAKETVESVSDTEVDVDTSKAEAAVNNFSNSLSKMSTATIAEVSKVKNEFQRFFTALDLMFTNNTPMIVAKCKNMFSMAITQTTTYLSSEEVIGKFRTVGNRMADGMINGLKSKEQDIKNEASRIAKAAATSAESALQIKSPSRVFTRIGKYCDEGLINGLRSLSDKVETEGSNVGNRAASGLSDAISGIDLTNLEDTDPVIRPVLDLTDVQNKAGLLNSLVNSSSAATISADFNRNQNAKAIENERSNDLLNLWGSKLAEAITNSANNGEIPVNVNVTLAGDANKMFNLVRAENIKFKKANGRSALA